MRTASHIKGISLLVASVASIALLPVLTRDVRGDVELPFSNEVFAPSGEEVLVVFAGFPGCSDTCPTTLTALDRVYRSVDSERLGVAFVNVLLHTPQQVSADYAASFNENFIGYSVADEQRAELYSRMGLMAGERIEDVASHKASIFVYQRLDERWMLASVYQKQPDHDTLVAHLRQLLSNSSRS